MHDFFHLFIDANELGWLIRELTFDFLWLDEEIFQEGPSLLYFKEQLDNIVDTSEIVFPLLDVLFELCYVFAQ